MHAILQDKKVIFFDVGYTLDYPASGDWMFINRFYAVAGEKLKACRQEDIDRARAVGMTYLAEHHLIPDLAGEIANMVQYYSIISRELGLHLTEQEILDVARDRSTNMDNYLLYPDAVRVLQALRKTHKLGIISDTWPSIEMQLATFGIRDYFACVTYSYDLGVFKPDPKMYLDALSKAGCHPEEAVFIDDGPHNLAGAAKLGITPILIAANPASDVEVPYLKIHGLTELLG